MTTMTFESIHHSPRRVAARRNVRPSGASGIVRLVAPVVRGQVGQVPSNQRGLFILIGLAVVLHVAIIGAVQHAGPIEALPPKVEPLAIEFAPPPPPPPEVKPKPLPQLPKPVVALPKPAPSVPVVSQAPVDTAPTADTVAVAQAAPPAPPAPPPPAPEPVTEPRGFAGYLSNPAPVYPVQAQDRGLEGRVILKVHVLASGKPDNVTVAKSSGHRILDDAAIKAVQAWAFDPAKRGRTPIDGWVNVPLNFKLS